jgi:vancomycin resistance protein YoaR
MNLNNLPNTRAGARRLFSLCALGFCAALAALSASAGMAAPGAVQSGGVKRISPKAAPRTVKGVTGVLGRFTTRFDTKQTKRAHNVRLAARKVDGVVIPPGGVFSLNKTVGERKHGTGFLTAPVFEDGKRVPGIGGGVSQVTGTVFNAALLAGLDIVEYHYHSRPVAYIPTGRDATVAWNLLDLRFRNNTKAPILVRCKAQGSRLTTTIYGAKAPGKTVRLSVVKKQVGKRHVVATLYRVTKKKGKVVSKERIGKADYQWKPDKGD